MEIQQYNIHATICCFSAKHAALLGIKSKYVFCSNRENVPQWVTCLHVDESDMIIITSSNVPRSCHDIAEQFLIWR